MSESAVATVAAARGPPLECGSVKTGGVGAAAVCLCARADRKLPAAAAVAERARAHGRISRATDRETNSPRRAAAAAVDVNLFAKTERAARENAGRAPTQRETVGGRRYNNNTARAFLGWAPVITTPNRTPPVCTRPDADTVPPPQQRQRHTFT